MLLVVAPNAERHANRPVVLVKDQEVSASAKHVQCIRPRAQVVVMKPGCPFSQERIARSTVGIVSNHVSTDRRVPADRVGNA
jgi:hypothetical protein